MPKPGITGASSYGEHFEARHITRTLSRRSPESEAYNPRLPRYGVTMGYDRRHRQTARKTSTCRLHVGRFRWKKMETTGNLHQEAS